MIEKMADKCRDLLYMTPAIHVQGNKEIYIENCKRIEEYNENIKNQEV